MSTKKRKQVFFYRIERDGGSWPSRLVADGAFQTQIGRCLRCARRRHSFLPQFFFAAMFGASSTPRKIRRRQTKKKLKNLFRLRKRHSENTCVWLRVTPQVQQNGSLVRPCTRQRLVRRPLVLSRPRCARRPIGNNKEKSSAKKSLYFNNESL